MSEATAAAIELDVLTVINAPLLGYEPGVLPAPLGEPDAAVAAPIRVPRTWIATENTPATIDVESFRDNSPFDELLGTEPRDSTPLPSLSGPLTDFNKRWRVSEQLHRRIAASPPIEALLVTYEHLEVLVWPEGMVIGVAGRLALAVELLIHNFAEQARIRLVDARPTALGAVLELLPAEVKSRYVPGAESFYEQAMRETREHIAERQHGLNSRRVEYRFNSDGRLERMPTRPTPPAGPPPTGG